jgi:protein SCO1/2
MNQSGNAFRKVLAASCVVAGALTAPATGGAHDAKEHGSRWQKGSDYQRSVHAYSAPDVVLTDSDGRRVNLRQLLDTQDAVMMNFIFTTCTAVCPAMVAVFADVPERFGTKSKNLRMISISIDPDNDTPAHMKAWSRNFGASAQWSFLTGSARDIKTVQLAFDGYRGDKMNHEPLTLMRPALGKRWVRIDGFANPDELVREYQKAASQ